MSDQSPFAELALKYTSSINKESSSIEYPALQKDIVGNRGIIVKVNSLKNLKPRKKGDPMLPGAGERKTKVSLKEAIRRISTKEEALTVARDIIDKAVSGSFVHQRFFAEMLGDFDNKINVEVNNNTLQIDIIKLANEYAMNKLNSVDVELLPVSGSIEN